LKRVLFLCSRNKLRSPTAEQIFGGRTDIEVASAGLAADAETPCTGELVDWADIIFVMEKAHRSRLTTRANTTPGSAANSTNVTGPATFSSQSTGAPYDDVVGTVLVQTAIKGVSMAVYAATIIIPALHSRWQTQLPL
jgi:protein-tyrosine-phosphatase